MATMSEDLKTLVREKYAEIARQSPEQNRASCCGAGGCGEGTYTVFSEDYSNIEGYVAEADLGLGCGVPTQYAQIGVGQTVLDLGSGAGNDVFVAQTLVGPTGKVIGLDMTESMVEKARENAARLGLNNVEFRLGDIEHMPIGPGRVDLVISNCVLNLVPDKEKAFSEIFRVLKPGGRFCISDVALTSPLPEGLRREAEMYAGCVAGALPKNDYLNIVFRAGFETVKIEKERAIRLPEEVLQRYLTPEELAQYQDDGSPVVSITLTAIKPVADCCAPGSGCC